VVSRFGDAGVLDQEGEGYVFVDPFFARYIREPVARVIGGM